MMTLDIHVVKVCVTALTDIRCRGDEIFNGGIYKSIDGPGILTVHCEVPAN